MKVKVIYLMVNLFVCLSNHAQINLVPNYSFEDTVGNNCWVQMGVGNSFLKNWYSCSSNGTPDYMNICANSYTTSSSTWTSKVPLSRNGYEMPRTGDAYIAMGIYEVIDPLDSSAILIEYTSVKLKQVLKSNTCYYGEFYTSLADLCEIGTNQLSMLLTVNSFTTASYSFTNTIQPQVQWDTTQYFTDTLNWVKISGKFIAQGGEQYLTFGNFKDGNHTKKIGIISNFISPENFTGSRKASFVFIDDVALYELPTPQLKSNAITICPDADSLLLGDSAKIQSTYKWYANNILIASTSTISVKPNQTTTYVLQTTQCNITTQTVIVTYSANCEPIVVVEPIIPNVFTPNDDSINDVWRINIGKGNTLTYLYIYNRWGNSIHSSNSSPSGRLGGASFWDGRTTSGEPTPSGVYFYVLQYTDVNGDEHKKNGYITLIR